MSPNNWLRFNRVRGGTRKGNGPNKVKRASIDECSESSKVIDLTILFLAFRANHIRFLLVNQILISHCSLIGIVIARQIATQKDYFYIKVRGNSTLTKLGKLSTEKVKAPTIQDSILPSTTSPKKNMMRIEESTL